MTRKGSAGFTLIELMIVIAIIAIIAAIAIPNLMAARLASNETAAAATLRTIISTQAQIAVAAKIDADKDGRGEYATLMELTASIGPRLTFNPGPPSTTDLSQRGAPLRPAPLTSVMGRVDPTGYCTKGGYAFIVFLPDGASPAGFVHEQGPKDTPTLGGGTGTIGIDMSETYWCAYAQPTALASSGNRRFFANERAEIMQSSNEQAQSAGTGVLLMPNGAYRGDNITSPAAIGTVGRDGDVWRVAN